MMSSLYASGVNLYASAIWLYQVLGGYPCPTLYQYYDRGAVVAFFMF